MILKVAVTDIETDGLYFEVTTFHCAWIFEVGTGVQKGYRPHEFYEYLRDLAEYDIIVGHNMIDYDAAALVKLNPKFVPPKIFDTLVLSRMLEPDRIQGHGLKQWGYALGEFKGDYGEQEDAWDVFTEDMFVYCNQDVKVTLMLYLHLCEKAGFDPENPPCSLLDYTKSKY